jgi:hypothetical protein
MEVDVGFYQIETSLVNRPGHAACGHRRVHMSDGGPSLYRIRTVSRPTGERKCFFGRYDLMRRAVTEYSLLIR